MKDQIRILGIDDGPFTFNEKSVPIIGVLFRAPNYIEGVLRSKVTIDGSDANSMVEQMIKRSNYQDQIKLIMFDGVALGGFNVIDIEELNHSLDIPISTITRTNPDMKVIKETLQKHFKDWKSRWMSINKYEFEKVDTNFNPIYIKFVGINKSEVKRLISLTTVRGVLPEPIRVAHLIATAFVRGESAGRA